MIIQFGLELEETAFPVYIDVPEKVELSCGINGLMAYLEKHLGIHYPERQDYLRYEQYRQTLAVYLEKNPTAFFASSFEADSIATAIAMLENRDELFLGNWDFAKVENMPVRLQVFAELEEMIQQGSPTYLDDGFAERYRKICYWVGTIPLPLSKIYLNEPLDILPSYIQNLMGILQGLSIEIIELTFPLMTEKGDLNTFQKALLKEPYTKGNIKADGSIIIIKGKRETYLAEYIAKLFAQNRHFQPVCLIPNKNRSLDNSLVEEGLPSFGILSASLARPTLQILKLVSTFLWKPINPYKILEFVSLPTTPIHSKLAKRIAKVMAEKPGLNSASWRAMVAKFFSYYKEEIERNPSRKAELEKEEKETRNQFNKWFNRRRYDTQKAVPKTEVIDLFTGVFVWSEEQVDRSKKKLDNLQKDLDNTAIPINKINDLLDRKEDLTKSQHAFLSLWEQSKRLIQILEALPERDKQMSYLRLERLVRSINEPAPMRFRKTELGHLPFVYHSSAIVRPTAEVFWWNFVQAESSVGFASWYPKEQLFLRQNKVGFDQIQNENKRLIWQRMQAVLKCEKRLILVCTQYVEGKEQLPHSLWGDLCAALGEGDLEKITVDLDSQKNIKFLEKYFALPPFLDLEAVQLGKPQPFLKLPKEALLLQRERESFSSLSKLLYYPYQWFFRYQADFSKASILSINKENRLKGNLAHSLFENLFKEIIVSENRPWSKEEIQTWVENYMPSLLEKEGAVLLMYGYEPERLGLVQTLKNAAWALVSMIQNNGWKIIGTEQLVEGKLANQMLFGYVDLVLQRGTQKAIIDLKWQGSASKKMAYKNKEDLQLVIYSKLLDNTTDWAHTAYFIIKDSKMIARNNRAFEEAEIATNEEATFQEIHQDIWQKIVKTYAWRMQQLEGGNIEVRTTETVEELEEMEREAAIHANELLELLAMKQKNAYYDDYAVLINQIE